MQLRLRPELKGPWQSSFLFVSVTLATTHVGQWPRLHDRVTNGVPPQRNRDKEGEIKTQPELSERVSIRKGLREKKHSWLNVCYCSF